MKPIAFLPRVWRQGRNYFSLVAWLLYTAFRGRTWKLTIAVALSLLHLATQAAAIYAVYWYGRQMEKGGAFSVPLVHIEINLKEQPEWLWVIVIFSTGCFILSAALMESFRTPPPWAKLMNKVSRGHAPKKMQKRYIELDEVNGLLQSLVSCNVRDRFVPAVVDEVGIKLQ